MGTRNLTVVIKNGETKVAQYCQWDGYPTGQGETVAEFIRDMNRPAFEASLDKCKFVDGDHIKNCWEECGADGSGFASMEVSNQFKIKFPEFHRDTGAKILRLIEDGKVTDLFNEIDFAADSLFCEYAYVIDLDNDALEVYKGFNKSPLDSSERFYKGVYKEKSEYHPIKLWVKAPFSEVTEDFMSKLEATQRDEEE
jgi:hypothetical protein